MAEQAVKFTQNAAADIKKTVDIVLGSPIDETTGRPRRLSFGKPPVWYCKIQSDYAGGATSINATPCQKDGTIFDGAVPVSFDLSCHQSQLQCYGNLMAGDVVRYNPYNDSQGGEITNQPIVATSDQYAVLQVGTSGTRVVFDYVRLS